MKRFLIIILSGLISLILTSCLTEEDKQEILKKLHESSSVSSSQSVNQSVSSSNSGSASSIVESSDASESSSTDVSSNSSSSTQIDNKPPQQNSNNNASSSSGTISKEYKNIIINSDGSFSLNKDNIPKSDYYSGRSGEFEYSENSSWRDYASSAAGNVNGHYAWEYDENIPNYNFNIPAIPYDVQGEGDTGANGSSFPQLN